MKNRTKNNNTIVEVRLMSVDDAKRIRKIADDINQIVKNEHPQIRARIAFLTGQLYGIVGNE